MAESSFCFYSLVATDAGIGCMMTTGPVRMIPPATAPATLPSLGCVRRLMEVTDEGICLMSTIPAEMIPPATAPAALPSLVSVRKSHTHGLV